MKRNIKRMSLAILITFAFLCTNFVVSMAPIGEKGYSIGGKNIVYASPKGFGGFKSGGFKSSGSKSGGFKSGLFKSKSSKSGGIGGFSIPKNSNKSYSGNNNSYSSRQSRSFLPFFIPWGGGFGHGGFGVAGFLFNVILVIIIIIVISRLIKRRR